jgi:addiction module HigA family antidote
MLNNDIIPDDIWIPPANRLESLKGKRKGQHSIRINGQWRLCFVWTDGNADHVEIADYHQQQAVMKKTLPNVHPGEVLLEEFLKPMGISQNALARAIGVPPRRINEIVLGKRAVSADTALRLARALRTSEQFWMGLQADYDLGEARNAGADAIRKVRSLAA